eukprot:Nitzschia sp. Nitz4//scaffold81_size91200//72407//73096//NITZ4_004998-RA/size91200-processed-gene-0.113-mRNA-1//1//CDS//3329558746//1767//frame0
MEVEGTTGAFPAPAPFSLPSPQQGVSPQPQAASPSGAVGFMVPGRPVRFDFVPVDNTGTKLALTLNAPGDLPQPLTLVNEVVVFLGAPIPADRGILVYWQLSTGQEQSGFELLGSLTTDSPSQVFRTGWSEHDQFLSLPPNQPVTLTIGLSMEPLTSVQNLASASTAATARRPYVAQKIAQDLYNFMQSFDTTGGSNGQMLVPNNIFERWWKRFENKSQRDPNFFLKSA